LKKITLKLVSIHIKDSPQAVPLAAASLKAQLDSVPSNSLRLDVSFHDYYVDSSADFISEDICRNIPDMIGFSTYLWNRHIVLEICRIIKKKFPAVLLFAKREIPKGKTLRRWPGGNSTSFNAAG